MNTKTIAITLGVAAVLGAGIYAGSQFIDWNAEGDKMAGEINDKNFWQEEQEKMEQDIADKNNGEEIDWNAEGDKMAYDLSDESALAKYNEIDWNKELEKMSDDLKTKAYVGTWQQVATYMDGELQGDSAKATLILTKDSYESKTGCASTGALKVVGDILSMTVKTNTCYGGMIGSAVSYDYQISKDGQILILDFSQGNFSMREVFKREK